MVWRRNDDQACLIHDEDIEFWAPFNFMAELCFKPVSSKERIPLGPRHRRLMGLWGSWLRYRRSWFRSRWGPHRATNAGRRFHVLRSELGKGTSTISPFIYIELSDRCPCRYQVPSPRSRVATDQRASWVSWWCPPALPGRKEGLVSGLCAPSSHTWTFSNNSSYLKRDRQRRCLQLPGLLPGGLFIQFSTAPQVDVSRFATFPPEFCMLSIVTYMLLPNWPKSASA